MKPYRIVQLIFAIGGLIAGLFLLGGLAFGHNLEGDPRQIVRHYDDYHSEGVPCHVHIYADGPREEWDVRPESSIAVNVNPPWLTEHLRSGHPHVAHDGNAEAHTHGVPHSHDDYGAHTHSVWTHTHEDEVADEGVMDSMAAAVPATDEITAAEEPVSLVNPCSVGELEIVSVSEVRNPRRLLVTLRNTGETFVDLQRCWQIVLHREDGSVVGAILRKSISGLVITPQQSKGEKHADTHISLLPRRLFPRLPKGERAVDLQYFYGSQTGFNTGDTLILYYEQIEVSRYPEPVQLSPKLNRTLTTTWGAMKR